MRHRFHSISPYFAMFPEKFVEKYLHTSPYSGVVFDPFCGRGTTVFQALLDGRLAAGCDVNPVAVCISGAKCDPPTQAELTARLRELRQGFCEPDDEGWEGMLQSFFDICFHSETLIQVRYLRTVLDWRRRKDDRFIAALCLGALHGESHKSPNYFSNRMPRTISTKPEYSIRWWRKNGCKPPRRDVFAIIEHMIDFRFQTPPPEGTAEIIQSDARQSGFVFPGLTGRVTDVITSPPYLNTTNYREDQWLRLWFLGGAPQARHDRHDDRHYSRDKYWQFIQSSITGVRPLLAKEARLVIRIGGRRFSKEQLQNGLLRSLTSGLDRDVALIGDGTTSEVERRQSDSFRGGRASRTFEHDFCFAV